MDKSISYLNKNKILIFLVLALLSLVIALVNIGFVTGFWIILFLWILIFLIFFINPVIEIVYILWLVIIISFTFSMLISFRVILSDSNTTSKTIEKSADGITLSTCTSTASDQPQMISGWKSTIYAAPLSKTTSPDFDKANNVRTFSYSGIKNKTDKNSVYSRIEKADGSYITGYGTTIEACSSDNKTTKSYTTADTNYVASDNVVASTHYLHGGSYLHGAGNYRIDVYLKTTDGKWHLIDRMNGIKVTD